MIIQFNTDHNVKGTESVSGPLTAFIEEELKRFSHQITRVEVHLSDENGNKTGINDKRCVLEARIENLKPIAVTSHANTRDQAVKGALDKLTSSLESTLGRLQNH